MKKKVQIAMMFLMGAVGLSLIIGVSVFAAGCAGHIC